MTNSVKIDPKSGNVKIGERFLLQSSHSLKDTRKLLADLITNERDIKNGYLWLNIQENLIFGDLPCALRICFYQSQLKEFSWGVHLPDMELERGWPTRKAIDEEIHFVRNELTIQLRQKVTKDGVEFPWGVIWSIFDQKSFIASHGLRYVAN